MLKRCGSLYFLIHLCVLSVVSDVLFWCLSGSYFCHGVHTEAHFNYRWSLVLDWVLVSCWVNCNGAIQTKCLIYKCVFGIDCQWYTQVAKPVCMARSWFWTSGLGGMMFHRRCQIDIERICSLQVFFTITVASFITWYKMNRETSIYRTFSPTYLYV